MACFSEVESTKSGGKSALKMRGAPSPWMHRFALLVAVWTMVPIAVGALVTSREAGMAVPDWPNTLGHNMFFVPFKLWVGVSGIYEEHSHRLVGALTGLLTTILAVWLWRREDRGWVRRMGVSAFVLVVVQGLLGGLRVTEINQNFGIAHGILGQTFLLLVSALALVTSPWWRRTQNTATHAERVPSVVRVSFILATVLIFIQLALGATMRHQHAGLPAWDFPKTQGQWWPAMDAGAVKAYNAERMALMEKLHVDGQKVFLATGRDIQPFHLALHMSHRLMGVLILAVVIGAVVIARRTMGGGHLLSRVSVAWLMLILVQVALGILTVIKYKPADLATLHVVIGALSLLTGAGLWVISHAKKLPASKPSEKMEPMAMRRTEAVI